MKRLIVLIALFWANTAHAQIQLAVGSTSIPIPFVGIDSTDHVSEKTGVTVSCARIKNGTAGSCAGTVAEVSNGDYKYTPGAGDVDTAGAVVFRFTGSGMDVARALVQVGNSAGSVSIASGGITSASFASGAITSAALAADAIGASQLAANAIGASELADGAIDSAAIAARGTAQAVSSTTLTLAASESWGNDALANKYGLYIASASGGNAGVYTCITANVGSTDVVTVAWPNSLAPSGTITYDLIPDAGCGATGGGSVDASSVWTYLTRTLTSSSSSVRN